MYLFIFFCMKKKRLHIFYEIKQKVNEQKQNINLHYFSGMITK
jgi:hypothetical protein